MLGRFEGKQGKTRLVDAFSDQELVRHDRALAETLAQVAKLNQYDNKTEIYVQGEPGKDRLYFVVSGAMDLLVNDTLVYTVRAGEALGEFPILDPGQSYTVTIQARERCVVATISEEDFRSIAEQYPIIWKNMAIMLMKRLKRTSENSVAPPKDACVFIGHGRSPLWAVVERYIEEELQLRTVTFESRPRAGLSTVSILEDMIHQATFAVLVLTGEDISESGKRARQNVVHEAGLFQGALGFRRAILLIQSGIEEFSNVHGLQNISFEEGRIEATFTELRETLKREGQIS